MNGISCKNLVYGMKYGMNLIGYTPRIRGPFLGAGAVLTLFPAKHEISKDHLRPSTARRPRWIFSCLVPNGLNVYNMYIICLNTYIWGRISTTLEKLKGFLREQVQVQVRTCDPCWELTAVPTPKRSPICSPLDTPGGLMMPNPREFHPVQSPCRPHHAFQWQCPKKRLRLASNQATRNGW